MTAIVNILSCIFEAIVIDMFINTYIDKKDDTRFQLRSISTFLIAISIILSNKILDLGLLNLLFVTLSISVISFIYSKNIKINLILAVVAIVILTMSEIIVVFFMTLMAGITAEQIDVIAEYKISGTLLSKLLSFFIFNFLRIKHKTNVELSVKTSYWFLFLIMFISSGMSIFLIFRLQYESHSPVTNNMSILCSLGLLYSAFFTLYLFENLSKQAKIEKKQEIFKQQIKAQSKHLDEILITQRELKRIKHDLANHNISIQAYFENRQYDEGIQYMKNMGSQIGLGIEYIETGNVALDAIINTKKSIARTKQIEFISNIQIPENMSMDAIDICIIFGNALDNAIEACERCQKDKKKIVVSVIYEDNSLICKISNTADKSNKKFLKTVKRDEKNHGFGIESIKSTLSKYKNIFKFEQTDDEFILTFIIFL